MATGVIFEAYRRSLKVSGTIKFALIEDAYFDRAIGSVCSFQISTFIWFCPLFETPPFVWFCLGGSACSIPLNRHLQAH
jgi:hypothetical protein